MSGHPEVPFRDFLFYLYQSASPSPSSTRAGSTSRTMPHEITKGNHRRVEESLTQITTRTFPSEKGKKGGMGIIIQHSNHGSPRKGKKTSGKEITAAARVEEKKQVQVQEPKLGSSSSSKTGSGESSKKITKFPQQRGTSRTEVKPDALTKRLSVLSLKETENEKQKEEMRNSSNAESKAHSNANEDTLGKSLGKTQILVSSHDLAFFKNVSANTRSKGQEGDSNQQRVSRNVISKRHSRSTPIALDVITSTNTSPVMPEVEIDISHHHHRQDQYLEYGGKLSESDEEPHNGREWTEGPVQSGSGGMITSPISEKGLDSLEDNRKTTGSKRRTLSNTHKFNPALVPARNNEGSGRRIDSTEHKTMSSTTVTLKMDNRTIFLDSLFVNLKQEVEMDKEEVNGGATSIKLYY